MVVKAQTLLVQLNAVHICCDEPHILFLSDHNYWQAKGFIFRTVYPLGPQKWNFLEITVLECIRKDIPIGKSYYC